MSCLHIHLVTLFNLAYTLLSWNILCHKTSFLWNALSFRSVYFGEIIRAFFLAIFVHRQIFPDVRWSLFYLK